METMLVNAERVVVILQGRADQLQALSDHDALPAAEYHEGKQRILYISGADYAPLNSIVEKDFSISPSEHDIDTYVRHFEAKQLPFIWWAAADSAALEKKGFQFCGSLKGIYLNISKSLPAKPIALPLEIREVQGADELRTFGKICQETYGMNEKAGAQFAAINGMPLKHGRMIHLLAYVDNVPVAAATLMLGTKVAGIWNLATLPSYRKRGIGSALVHKALALAKQQHYDDVMAFIMPKGMAKHIFEQMGFEEICDFPFYIYGIDARELGQ